MNGSTFEDFQPYMKPINTESFCSVCGLEIDENGHWGMCSKHYEQVAGEAQIEAYSPSLDTHFVPANGGSWRSESW